MNDQLASNEMKEFSTYFKMR